MLARQYLSDFKARESQSEHQLVEIFCYLGHKFGEQISDHEYPWWSPEFHR